METLHGNMRFCAFMFKIYMKAQKHAVFMYFLHLVSSSSPPLHHHYMVYCACALACYLRLSGDGGGTSAWPGLQSGAKVTRLLLAGAVPSCGWWVWPVWGWDAGVSVGGGARGVRWSCT